MKLPHTFLAAVLLATAVNAGAATCDASTRNAPSKFMVSVVLQRSGDELIIKLAHAIEAAATPEEATTRVLRQVAKSFPGYVVANTLATRVDDMTSVCPRPATTSPASGQTAI